MVLVLSFHADNIFVLSSMRDADLPLAITVLLRTFFLAGPQNDFPWRLCIWKQTQQRFSTGQGAQVRVHTHHPEDRDMVLVGEINPLRHIHVCYSIWCFNFFFLILQKYFKCKTLSSPPLPRTKNIFMDLRLSRQCSACLCFPLGEGEGHVVGLRKP